MPDILEQLKAMRSSKLIQADEQLENRLKEQVQSELNGLVKAHDMLRSMIREREARRRRIKQRVAKLDRDLNSAEISEFELCQVKQERAVKTCQLMQVEVELAAFQKRKQEIRERILALAEALMVEPPQLKE